MQKIHVKQNDEAQVGQTILSVSGGSATSDSKPADKTETSSKESEQKDQEGENSEASTGSQAMTRPYASPDTEVTPPKGPRLIPAAPSVRRMAREKGIDIRSVEGSGILGRISAGDLERPASGAGAAPAGAAVPAVELPDFSKWGETERVPMSGIRKATVRAMTQAWSSVPMVTHFDKADSSSFDAFRQKYKRAADAKGVKLTPTAILLKIAAEALSAFPDFNASIDTRSNEIIYKRYINIGIAVDTPNGLLVPVVKDANKKGIYELASDLSELAAKARDRKLSPDEMQGGNFNISNLGGIGGTGFTPIVNPPQVAILGVSRGTYEPVYNAETAQFDAKMMMPLSLTYDHRLIDGAAAARFLRWICEVIEDPFVMLLG